MMTMITNMYNDRSAEHVENGDDPKHNDHNADYDDHDPNHKDHDPNYDEDCDDEEIMISGRG